MLPDATALPVAAHLLHNRASYSGFASKSAFIVYSQKLPVPFSRDARMVTAREEIHSIRKENIDLAFSGHGYNMRKMQNKILSSRTRGIPAIDTWV